MDGPKGQQVDGRSFCNPVEQRIGACRARVCAYGRENSGHVVGGACVRACVHECVHACVHCEDAARAAEPSLV